MAQSEVPTASQVLLLSELFPPAIGGSAVLFEGIYSRLHDLDVRVLADCGPVGALQDEQRGALRVFRRALATSRWGLLDPRGFAHHLRCALRLGQLASRRRVVHCGRALPEGVTALLSRLMGGPRYVCWAHGEDLALALRSREFELLTKWVYRFAEGALANSCNTATLLESLGVPGDKIEIVYPGVDADRFRPDVDGRDIRARYAGPRDVLLLSVGRLQRRKGHDVAIEAVAELSGVLPNLRYVIAGDGDERERLEQLAAARGVRNRVFFAGAIADDLLPAYYAACDVFLLPNRNDDGDIEGFGIVFLEAAAAGKPVIGGDSGGVPEAVERDVTGLLVDGASVAHVAAAIRELAHSEDRRFRMGHAGRNRVQESFSWQRAAAIVREVQTRIDAPGTRGIGRDRRPPVFSSRSV